MNLLQFLASKRGAIKTLPALGISAAAGVAFVYTANFTAHQHIEAQRAVRSLSSITQTAPQEGMHRRGGLLTSINVRDGRNELATAEERAAMGGNSALDRYNANQRALNQMDGYLGRAASFSESEGLGGGGKEADFIGTQYVQGTSVNVDGAVAGAIAHTKDLAEDVSAAGPSSQTGGPSLAPASVARASGNAFGGSAGAVSGGVAGGTRSGGGNRPGTAAEGVRMSGAMPGGTNIVSRMGLDNAQASAGFARGRDGRVTRGQRITQSRDELKDVTRRSAKTAASNNPAANEGAAAFLANSTRSGGVTVEGPGENTGGSSADLAAPTAHRLKAIGNKLKDQGNEQEERNKAQEALLIQLLLTALGSVGLMIAGAKILGKMDNLIMNARLEMLKATTPAQMAAVIAKVKILTIKRWAIAGAMMAAVAAANTVLFVKAVEFMDKYNKFGGTGLAKAALIISPCLVAGMTYIAIKPEGFASLRSQIAQRFKSVFDPVSVATNSITSGLFK